jgi:putative exporter of polyketide antibiotics
VPLVPAADIDPVTTVIMLAVTAAGVAIGAFAFRRRDLQDY